MADAYRGPGRPARGSRVKLVAAMRSLLAQHGYAQTSPKMVLEASGVGQGSLYHHFAGKEGLALEAVGQMRETSVAFLAQRGEEIRTPGRAVADTLAAIESVLRKLFIREEGRALVRLLADAQATESANLARALQTWGDELRAVMLRGLDDETPRCRSGSLSRDCARAGRRATDDGASREGAWRCVTWPPVED